jgi:hypothetical protein
MMKYHQIEIAAWPSGDTRAIALLSLEPEELATRLQVTFSDGEDDLDRLKHAGLRLSDGAQILLVRHLNAPKAGTDVYADANANPITLLRRFLAATGLSQADVVWRPAPERRAEHA